MSDLNLTSFNPLYPMRIHPYKELLNDSNVNIMDKVNAVIDYLNQVGKLTNDVVKDWNTVYQWVMNDGLTNDVNNKLEAMLANHEFDPIMNNILTKIGDLTTLQTVDKDTLVHAINDLVTEIGSLSSLQTSDKSSIVNAINANVASLAESASDIHGRGINIMYPPAPLVGAKGDGTDESTVIQNIINSLINVGGKIFIPLKTFYVQGLSITGNQSITFEGLGTFKLPNGATQNLFNIDIGAGHWFKGITLDGNKTNVSATVDGVHFNDYTGASTWQPSGFFDSVSIKNFTGNGIYAGLVRDGGQLYRCNISSCGYGLRTPDSGGVADWIVVNNQFGDSNYNIYGHFTAGQFLGNAIYRAVYTNVTLLGQTWYSWIIGNSIDSSQQVGLAINGDPTKDNMNMIIGNSFFGNSSSGNGMYSDITAYNLNLTNIVSNTFFLYAGTNIKTKYALEFLSSNNRAVTFANNNFKVANFATGVVSDASKVFGYNYGLAQTIPEAITFQGSNNFTNYYTISLANGSNLANQIFNSGQGTARYQQYGDGKQVWGSGTSSLDANFYRSGVGMLKTDTKLIAGTGLGVGNSVTASTLGSVTKKMEVFDASGNSLGFVPIYNSIT